MSEYYKGLLDKNKAWVQEHIERDPEFFERMAGGQEPPILWIGCSDSRVPANELIGAMPGEVFVHRNIANMVVHSDMNMLSVLDYAVNVLKVQYVIVCGHYGCGGVKAAMGTAQIGLIDNWIRHIKDVYKYYKEELDAVEDETERFNLFVELNVKTQALDLARTSIVQNAWANKQKLTVHGWVYGVHDGIIHDLNVTMGCSNDLDEADKSGF
ncbi:MAG: carbonic anhydrase [Bacteroidota bacterium]